jgi:hypothetical protein
MSPALPIPVIAPARPAPARAELEAPTAEFLRLDGASGEASPETIRSYQAEVGAGVRWCEARGIVPAEASGRRQLKRLCDRLMLSLMALHGLRTMELHRASLEDLSERGPHLALLVHGKVRDRLVHLRPDTAERLKAYLALRGPVASARPCRPAHHRPLRARGGHGQAQPGAVHSRQWPVSRNTPPAPWVTARKGKLRASRAACLPRGGVWETKRGA